MSVSEWIATRFRSLTARRRPVLLRIVDDAGKPVPRIELVGSFLPSRKAFRSELIADRNGTCILQWVSGADRMRFVARHAGEEADVEIAAYRKDPERVVQVRLGRRAAR